MKLQPRTDVTAVLLLTAVTFVTRLFFLYRGGMGDPDSMVMAAGMAMGLNSDSSFAATLLYGRQAQPGMYLVTHVVYPLFFDTPAHMVGFLNWFNLIVSSLLVWPLYALFRRTMTPAGTMGAVLLFSFSPMVWELGTYFHPLMPATLFAFLAILAWDKIDSSARGIVYFLLSYAAGSVAVMMRASIFFLFPAFFVWALLSARKKRNVLLSSIHFLLIVLTYLAAVYTVFDSDAPGKTGIMGYASNFYNVYIRNYFGPVLAKQAVWATMSVGVATSLLCLFGAWRWLRSPHGDNPAQKTRDARLFAIAAAWVLPSVLFWLPSPVPIMRHYFLPAVGIAWFAGYSLLSRTTARRAYAVAFIAIITNLLLPEAAYRTYNKTRAASAKEPHGTFFYCHEKANNRIARLEQLQRSVMEVVRRDAEKRPDGSAPGVFAEVYWEGYGHLLYALASTEFPLRKTADVFDRGDLHFRQYELGGAEVRLVHIFPGDVDRKNAVARRIKQAIAEGYVIFLPAESVGPVYDLSDFAGDVRVY